MADQTGGAAADSTAAPPAPPLPHRRPRVREVSSRFMSPLIQSNSTPPSSDFPRSKSAHRRQPDNLIPEPNHSSDKSSKQIKRHNKENSDPIRETPIATTGAERIVPSRFRQVSNSVHRSNSINNSSSNGCSSTVTAAAMLLQEATTTSRFDESDTCKATTASNRGSSSCPNSPLCVSNNVVRSSMSDVDKWLVEKNCENSNKDCMRSLNFSSRPPQHVRSGFDARKGRKLSNHQEDVHSLKMLSNYYLQWRFANAKAEASVLAKKHEAERKLYSLGCKISELRDKVKRKRNEVAVLRGIQTLNTIVEAQMPYLDEWSTLEEDYSNSLSGTTNALLSSSIRLPVSGEVRADAGELKEALNSALKVVELIGTHIQRFTQRAEEMDISVSELARMVGGEKALIEDCGDLISKTYSSQVKECSLRGTLMQFHYCKNQKIEATT